MIIGPEPIIKTDEMDLSLGMKVKCVPPKINVNVETKGNKN